jgi:hypothetical protein
MRPAPRDHASTESAPSWISEELIAETLDVWQPYYEKSLTRADALEILQSVGRLIDVLETPAT